jgi:hypothetical protein
MTKKTAIGHVNCPICGFADAEVKEDKNQHAYIHCTDCNAQTFSRNDYRNSQLRKRMRPVTVTVADTVTVTGQGEPEGNAQPAARKGPPRAEQAPTPPAAQKPAKQPWFTPLLATGGKNA